MLRNKVFLLLLIFFCLRSQADILALIGENNVFEREAYPTQYTSRSPLVVRVGYQEDANAIFGEYNQYSTTDGMSQLEITRTQRELLVWGRHIFWPESLFQLYVQGAPGVELEYVKTDFMGQSSQDTSKPYFALAAAAGGAVQYERFRVELEFRALSSGLSSPNPTLSVGFYGGYVF